MKQKRYLLTVLGLSAIPRVVTFVLTLASFPLMVRALGAAEYGTVVYLTSIALLLAAFADCGVSQATGKAIAAARIERPELLSAELRRWSKLQVLVALAGLVLTLAAGYLLIARSSPAHILLYVLLAFAAWVAIGTTFIKAALVSLLAFKRVAVMDTIESLLRSFGWLLVAFVWPTARALAIVGLISAVALLLIGVPLAQRSLRGSVGFYGGGRRVEAGIERIDAHMIRDSMQFFGLRFATRAFQSLPLFLLGRIIGAEVVGILGAFTRIAEMLMLPLTVLGNALAVRAHEVRARGSAAIREYWRVTMRLGIVALAIAGGFLLMSPEIARTVVPQSAQAPTLFSIMSALFLAQSISSLFAPASDYVGGLGRRAAFLMACSMLQLPLIWMGATLFREVGAITSVALAYCAMTFGYVLIARRAFFDRRPHELPVDIPVGACIVLVVVGCCMVGRHYLRSWIALGRMASTGSLVTLVVYVFLLGTLFALVPALKRIYPTLQFLEF
jgi:O-antigen/teichoic acid export membrane protein